MNGLLLDADAFLNVRSLGLLAAIEGTAVRSLPILLTEYVARSELSTIEPELAKLKTRGWVLELPVGARNPDFKRLRQDGVDKGEAEGIALALTMKRAERPLFVSVDGRARQVALDEGVSAGDLMDLIVRWVGAGIITMEGAKAKAAPAWDDRRQQRGRPVGYLAGFDATFHQRCNYPR